MSGVHSSRCLGWYVMKAHSHKNSLRLLYIVCVVSQDYNIFVVVHSLSFSGDDDNLEDTVPEATEAPLPSAKAADSSFPKKRGRPPKSRNSVVSRL